MIRIVKIQKQIYEGDGFHVFTGWCGEKIKMVYFGDNPPKPLKTVDYKIIGEFTNDENYGEQFVISEYERADKTLIAKYDGAGKVRGQTVSEWLK